MVDTAKIAKWLKRPVEGFELLPEVSLTKRFALLSFLILVIGMVVIGWWVNRQIESGVMARTAAVTASFVTSSVSPHLQSLNVTTELSQSQMEALDRLLFETDLGQRVVSFKVWSPDGRILYSPKRNIVGELFPTKPDLERALAGETISHISDLSDPENVYERQRFTRLQETYTPLRILGSGEIAGAVEFYEGTAALNAEVQAARLRSWLVVGAATLAMYALLVGMVKGASLTITRQRTELAQAAAQREMDRMKADFISAVSHELRTPLGFIKGYTTTLLRDDLTVEDTTRREFLQIIDEESSNLQRMIDDLLDASRLQAGRLEMNRTEVSVKELLDSALNRTAPISEQGGHLLETHVPPTDVVVLADAGRIQQVLHNLIDNAAQHSRVGSSIRIDADVDGQSAVISVTDHGDGIYPQELERIFEPFYRGRHSRGRRGSGAGLGLSVSRGIVEAHGGEIRVESRPGRGSTFSFTLPLADGDLIDDADSRVAHDSGV